MRWRGCCRRCRTPACDTAGRLVKRLIPPAPSLVALALFLAGCGVEPDRADAAAMPDAAVPDLTIADLLPEKDLLMAGGPSLLSQTGLYSDFASRTLAP